MVKSLATEIDSLDLIPRTYMAEKTDSCKAVLTCIHTLTHVHHPLHKIKTNKQRPRKQDQAGSFFLFKFPTSSSSTFMFFVGVGEVF